MSTAPPRLTRGNIRKPPAGIVHLGLGAFFRAHGAIYIQEAMEAAGGDWGIIGVSLRSAGVRDRLAPQGGVYTALSRGAEGDIPQLVSSVGDPLVAPESPEAILEALAGPGSRLVTLTITEKGYCHAPSTGRLDLMHPDIRHDLQNPEPKSAPGFLVRALELRRNRSLPPFTVLSCDNLPENGKLVRQIVCDMAREIDTGLVGWIAEEGRFPSTMVDRIVPATKASDIEQVEKLTGRHDAAPVVHEPFRQWVIEDDFVDAARPRFEAAGAQLVADVRPFETMKLRMLNGTHSALAYLGYLAGHETVAEAAADPLFARYLDHLWQREIIPTLASPPDTDLSQYAQKLFDRYRNPSIRHLTWQIAMDGSQKLQPRILSTISDNLKAEREFPGLALAVAGWMRYVSGTDEHGRPIDVRDPLSDALRRAASAGPTAEDQVTAFLALRQIFPADLAENSVFKAYVSRMLSVLTNSGARAALGGIVS